MVRVVYVAPCVPHQLPHPDTSLTYIQGGWLGRNNAGDSETRPAGSEGGLTRTAFARQGFPCIASLPGFSLVILILQQSHAETLHKPGKNRRVIPALPLLHHLFCGVKNSSEQLVPHHSQIVFFFLTKYLI